MNLALAFFGYAYYRENSDNLKILSVDGVMRHQPKQPATAVTPLARPLYLYTSEEILQNNQAASISTSTIC